MPPIVFIINNLGMGGAERLVIDQMRELSRRKIRAILVTLIPEKEGRSLSPEEVFFPITLIRFRGIFDFLAYVRLLRFLLRLKPRAVVTHLWFANTVGRICARCVGIRAVISFEHNVYDRVKTRKQFLVDRLLQRFSRTIVAVSHPVRESLVRHHIAPERIIVIENALDLDRYRLAAPAPIRSDLRLGSSFIFIFVGRLLPQKGVDILLSAFSKVGDGILLIVGDGVDREMLKVDAERLGVRHAVYFLGSRTDIPNLLAAAGCFVFPSRWEGMPIALMEALTAGLPVVASSFEGSKKIVGGAGLIVPLENPHALADAMIRVREDARLRDHLSAQARVESERFSITRHIDTLLTYVD